jgi:hypothetical protein
MVTVRSNVPIATMVKLHEGTIYIFAIAMENSPSMPRFVVDGIGDSQGRVIGEQRRISISQGAFEDSLSGYGVHLYAISDDPNQIFLKSP